MKEIITPYIYILLFCLTISEIYSQKFQLIATSKINSNQAIFEEIPYIKIHQTKKSVMDEINNLSSVLKKKGYLNITLDTLFLNDSIYTSQFNLGIQTKTIKIFFSTESMPYHIVSKKILQQISTNYTANYFEIPFHEISKALQFIVDDNEKNGNSFVQVSLKNVQIDNSKTSAIAQLYISETKKRTIDKVIVKGYNNFPKNFIPYDLNLKIGSVFNTEKLKNASIAINNIPFAEEQKPPEVLFTKDSTFIYLYLNKRNSNKFDGVVGFTSKKEGNGLEFNGYLDFLFNNIFNSGESIALFWKNNGFDSQRFYISAETPYLFSLPIIPKVNFQLFRQDTSFTNTTTDLSIKYILNNKSKITSAISAENSNNLLNNQSSTINIKSYKNIFYGLGYQFKTSNNHFLFPDKFIFDLYASTGARRSNTIKTTQTKLKLLTNYLWSFNYKNHLFFQNNSSILISDNYLNNELFRIGGVNNIRGFNEESVFTSAYSIFNLEYRFNPSNTNYFFTISDFALVKDESLDQSNQLFSLGLGYAFSTKAGLLNLSYAVGKTDRNPFNFNNSKLHIKLISYF